MWQQLERRAIGVTLPDDVHVAHRQRQTRAAEYPLGDVHEDAVSEIDRVVQSRNGDARPPIRRKVLEHPLAAEARRGILAHGPRLESFGGAAAAHRYQR